MSTEWEVVGKQKKGRKQTGDKKNQQPQDEPLLKGPKIEDSMDSICALYTDVKDDLLAKFYPNFKNTNHKDLKPNGKESGKQPATPVLGQPHLQPQQSQGNSKSESKESDKNQRDLSRDPVVGGTFHMKAMKDFDPALRAINASDLHSQLTAVNVNFKDNHLMMLKALTAMLNDKLRFREWNPVFLGKSISYPYKSMPEDLRKVIDDCIMTADEENVKYFYDLSLSNLASDMNKNLPYVGTKLVLQAIATHYPTVCVNNLARNAILRNSYQNRPDIGLSLLWALGQGGFSDLDIGLKVWQDIMVPVIDMENYNWYACEYVHRILKMHRNQKLGLGGSEFLTILSSLTTRKKSSRQLDEAARMLVERYVLSSPKPSATFAMLFKNISFITRPDMIYYGLILCLYEDPETAAVWLGLYRQSLPQSLAILEYLNNSTQDYCKKLFYEKHFHRFLAEVDKINSEISQAKKTPKALKSLTAAVKDAQAKSKKKQSSGKANSKSSSSVTSVLCKLLLSTFLLFGITGALVGYDTYRAGGKFEASLTGQTLKQAGLLPAVQDAWTCSMKYSARGYKWAEANVPVYYQATSKALGPYVEFSIDFSKVLWNGAKKGFASAKVFATQKLSDGAFYVEQYAPGLPKKISDASCTLCDTVCTFTTNAYKHTYEFFKTKVFVGQLSPESLGKVFNSTQQAAAQYYSWFNDQVDFYAKLK